MIAQVTQISKDGVMRTEFSIRSLNTIQTMSPSKPKYCIEVDPVFTCGRQKHILPSFENSMLPSLHFWHCAPMRLLRKFYHRHVLALDDHPRFSSLVPCISSAQRSSPHVTLRMSSDWVAGLIECLAFLVTMCCPYVLFDSFLHERA
jgi:hypothetical protein